MLPMDYEPIGKTHALKPKRAEVGFYIYTYWTT